MMKLVVIIGLFSIVLTTKAQPENTPIVFSDALSITKLSPNVFLYKANFKMEPYGKVSSNGVIVVDGSDAILIDTPWTDSLTTQLILAVESKLNVKFTKTIVTHWHIDRMGGLQALIDKGIESISTELTRKIAEEKELPIPSIGFTDSLALKLTNESLICYYPGGGHTADNCVVWIPNDSILYGGCLVKEVQAPDLGNVTDAVLISYPTSIRNLLSKYYNAKIVIPGHGKIGGQELLTHTYQISRLK